MDEREIAARGLADLLARRAARNCPDCGRPIPVCDADYCEQRLRYSCPECRGPGIFHQNECSRRRP